MLFRNMLIASTTIVAALFGTNLIQEAIALPTSSTDVLLMSQANPTAYTVEVVEVMDINSDADTLWVRAMEGDNTHRPLSAVPAPILSIAHHGDILYLLKSGSYVVDVAWSDSEFGLDQIEYDVEAARAEVQAVYRSLLANTESQPVVIPPAQVYTPRPRPQPTPEPAKVPIRGLW